MERKTIMHLIATNFYGGPEKQILEHLGRLNKEQFRGLFASFLEYSRMNESLEKAKQKHLDATGIVMMGPLDIRAQANLTRLVRQQKVDLLCVHGYKACVMGWWTRLRLRVPVIAFSRGYTAENPKIAFYNWLERQAIVRLDGIVFVSEGQKRKLERLGKAGTRNWVVHNAVAILAAPQAGLDRLRMEVALELGVPKDAQIIIAAGRLSPEKGHRYLLKAVAELSRARNNCYFVFCGEGPCRAELEDLARNLGVSDRCRFVGFRRDIARFYRAMDLMVLPSLTEGLPNVVLEAFAYAKPVVASCVGGVPEVVKNGENGLLVAPGRPAELAEAMRACLGQPERLTAMGQAGYERVRSQFTFEAQALRLEEIYQEVLDSGCK